MHIFHARGAPDGRCSRRRAVWSTPPGWSGCSEADTMGLTIGPGPLPPTARRLSVELAARVARSVPIWPGNEVHPPPTKAPFFLATGGRPGPAPSIPSLRGSPGSVDSSGGLMWPLQLVIWGLGLERPKVLDAGVGAFCSFRRVCLPPGVSFRVLLLLFRYR